MKTPEQIADDLQQAMPIGATERYMMIAAIKADRAQRDENAVAARIIERAVVEDEVVQQFPHLEHNPDAVREITDTAISAFEEVLSIVSDDEREVIAGAVAAAEKELREASQADMEHEFLRTLGVIESENVEVYRNAIRLGFQAGEKGVWNV